MEPQSFFFSTKRSFVWATSQEEMSFEGSPVKALPASRRRMMPPTPQHSSHSSIEDMQLCSGKRKWRYKEVAGMLVKETVITRMENYLNKRDCLKVEIEELELLECEQEGQKDLRDLQHESKSEHFVASTVRWDERQWL